MDLFARIGSFVLEPSPSSSSSSESPSAGDKAAAGKGAGGMGTMIALSRHGAARWGREERVWVVARRREVQRQW